MNKVKRFIVILFFIATALSCSRVEAPDVLNGDKVDVNLSVSVLDMVPMAMGDVLGGTKSVSEDVIKNLWIIQFNGTTDESTMLGNPVYVEDFSTFDGNVSLVASSEPCYIYLIANTFEDPTIFTLPQGYKISDLKTRLRNVATQNDIMSLDEEGNYHPIFISRIEAVEGVSLGANFTSELKRNISKVDITVVNNSSGEDAVSIESVQICSVPNVSYYVGNEESSDAPYPLLEPEDYIDYEEIQWVSGNTSSSFTTYLPVNLQGVFAENTSVFAKNRYAPTGTTYLLVRASYKNSNNEDVPLTYTFYLGGNLLDDYNLRSNHHYKYTFTINAKGDSDRDARVYDWGVVDFSDSKYPLANCYILNPIPDGSIKRRFRIPIQRVMSFWGTEGKALWEDDKYLSLRENEGKWRAWVLTSDFEISSDNFVLTKSEGVRGADKYFEVAVAPGVKGNVIVAVGPNDGSGTVSWSWHLWITDYDPYGAIDWGDGVAGKYIYPVPNGALHRYEGAYWEANKDTYIMDRNLGWLTDPDIYPDDNIGLLYYQYGRKDPFFFSPQSSINAKEVGSDNIIKYAINNPLIFFITDRVEALIYQPWCTDSKYNPSETDKNIVWMDPRTSLNEQNQGEKSIFDPCPPGYRLPINEIWSDFRAHENEKRTTNSFSNEHFKNGYIIEDGEYVNGFKPFNQIKGMQYWPYQGEDILIPDHPVYYPASGYLDPLDAKIVHHGNLIRDNEVNSSREKWGFSWSRALESYEMARAFTAQQDHLSTTKGSFTQARGLPVRCITER